MRVNFVDIWRRLRQALATLRRRMATVYELEPGGIRARQIFCHQRPDRRSEGSFTAVLIHRRGQIDGVGAASGHGGIPLINGCAFDRANVRLGLPAQPVDATQASNLSAGVSNARVLRGRSFSWRATLFYSDEFESTPTNRSR